MSDMHVDRPTYRVGEVSPYTWLSPRRLIIAGLLVGAAIIGLIAITLTQNVVVMIATAAMAGLIWATLRRRDQSGGRWLVTGLGQLIRGVVADRADWDRYAAEPGERPFGLEHVRALGWTDEVSGTEIGFLDIGSPDSSFVAAVEIAGDGEGIHSGAEHFALEGILPAVLRRLASPGMSVSQLSLVSRSVPTDGSEYREWQDGRLLRNLPAGLDASMRELAGLAEEGSQEIRSWAIICMPIDRLRDDANDIGLRADAEGVAAAAALAVSKVTRAMLDEGMEATRALSIHELGALVRGLWLPDRDADDTAGVRGFWPAWPAFRPTDKHYESVTACDPATGEEWHHSVGTIPLRAWPSGSIHGRWLEPLVLTGAGVPFRTIAVSFLLIPQQKARAIAKSQLTSASGKVYSRRRRRQVQTGEEEAAESVAQTVTFDVTKGGEAGVVASLWVDIAAKSPRLLARRREVVEGIVESTMTAQQWHWQHGRHVPAMYMVLPIGRAVL